MPKYIKYPTEHKMETAERVTYNAKIEKLYGTRTGWTINRKRLTAEKMLRLLEDIFGPREGEK